MMYDPLPRPTPNQDGHCLSQITSSPPPRGVSYLGSTFKDDHNEYPLGVDFLVTVVDQCT